LVIIHYICYFSFRRELDTLSWLSNQLESEQQALSSSCSKISSRLKMQLPAIHSSSSSSSSAAQVDATGTASDLEGLVMQLCNVGDSLRQNITDAADAVMAARNDLQQLAAAHNPHASGVVQLQQLVGEKQQQLQENQQGVQELTQQVRGWI
jgi:DNA repair ATPase RecN